jgi:hypothetical protein
MGVMIVTDSDQSVAVTPPIRLVMTRRPIDADVAHPAPRSAKPGVVGLGDDLAGRAAVASQQLIRPTMVVIRSMVGLEAAPDWR